MESACSSLSLDRERGHASDRMSRNAPEPLTLCVGAISAAVAERTLNASRAPTTIGSNPACRRPPPPQSSAAGAGDGPRAGVASFPSSQILDGKSESSKHAGILSPARRGPRSRRDLPPRAAADSLIFPCLPSHGMFPVMFIACLSG